MTVLSLPSAHSFSSPKNTFRTQKHCKYRWNGQKHNTGDSSWTWLLSKGTEDPRETLYNWQVGDYFEQSLFQRVDHSLTGCRVPISNHDEGGSLVTRPLPATPTSLVIKAVSEGFEWQKKPQSPDCPRVFTDCLTNGWVRASLISDSALIVFSHPRAKHSTFWTLSKRCGQKQTSKTCFSWKTDSRHTLGLLPRCFSTIFCEWKVWDNFASVNDMIWGKKRRS